MKFFIPALLACMFLSGCGGVFYITLEPSEIPVEPGKYDVVFEAQQDKCGCGFFPEKEEQVWHIHEEPDGLLWLVVEGLVLESRDGSIFRGTKDVVSVVAKTEGTDYGFEGVAIMNISISGIYNCTDYAKFDATRIEVNDE